MKAPRVALLAVLGIALPGCGPSASELLSQTAENLDEINSGELRVRVLFSGRGPAEGEAGFELEGPFALSEEGELPVADIEYTQIAGEERQSATFLSTGKEAFLEVDGRTYEMPTDQAEQLRGAASNLDDAGGGLNSLEIGAWIRDADATRGGVAGGAVVDRVEGELNLQAAANDLLAIAGGLGATTLPQLEGTSAEQLERAVESSRIEISTGADDRLLRKVEIDVELGLERVSGIEGGLGDLGASLLFELEITDPNKEVRVDPPEDVSPASELAGT
jgi:hypothetical protein